MATPTCTKCRKTILPDDINVATDVAYCRNCNISNSLARLTIDDSAAAVDLNRPPNGAWFTSDGSGTVIGATNRSLGTAAGTLVMALFWNGIVSVFVCVALSGTLHVLHLPLPVWFPAPKMNGGNMGVGMVLFLWLFLAPFIAIGVFLAGSCLSALFGRTEVRQTGMQGVVFTGIGILGWRRCFDASQVKDVRLHQKNNSEGSDTYSILIETRDGKQVKLGSMLSSERRQFVLGATRKALLR